MALQFMDGFGHYQATDLQKKWTTVGTPSNNPIATGGRRGGGMLVLSNNNGYVRRLLSVATDTLIAGFAISPLANSSTANQGFLQFLEGASLAHVSVSRDTSNRIIVRRGNYNGTLLGTAPDPLPTGMWSFVEVKAKIHDTAGEVEVRVNGVRALLLENIDTRDGGTGLLDTVALGLPGGFTLASNIDDFYCCDTSGTINNDFFGDVRIEEFYPSGAGTHQQWTPKPTQAQIDAAYQHWRLQIDASAAGPLTVTELEMRAAIGGADQCVGGASSADTGFGTSHSAAFDDTSASASSNSTTGWLQYTFATPVVVKEITIKAPGSSENRTPTRFRLQASSDGASFFDVAAWRTSTAWLPNETRAFAVPAVEHYSCVNLPYGETPDASSRLLVGGAVGSKETFTLASSATLPASDLIVAVQLNNLTRKSDAGGAAVRNLVRSAGAEAAGPTQALSTSYNYVRSLHEINPATGQPWLLSQVQAMEAGLEVVS